MVWLLIKITFEGPSPITPPPIRKRLRVEIASQSQEQSKCNEVPPSPDLNETARQMVGGNFKLDVRS